MPPVPDAAGVARSNAASFSAIAGASPSGRVARFGDAAGTLVPAAPERPLLNGVFALGEGFDDAYAWVEDGCREAGIEAFTVWLDGDDEAAGGMLERRGHTLDGRPPLMAARLGVVATSRALSLPEVERPSPAVAAELNDAVYGYPGSFQRAFSGAQQFPFLLAAAEDEGKPVACAAGLAVGDDLHLTMVATLPEYRGRGLAGALIALIARRALATGCTTASLVSSAAGAPMYEHLGYSTVGALQMWERRLA